ncbi:MAG TPA: hypothetical protein VK808_13145 [Bacteroidia bacterium]|nr:hypothetical protein [Bacteroidia bacterium]
MRLLKYGLLVIMSVFTISNAWCQLEPFQDDDAIVTPNFNRDIIKAKKISHITIASFTKPDGAAINDDGIIRQYFFDTTGNIMESVCTIKTGANSCDTVTCKYYYDNNGNINIKRTKMGDFYDTWYYKWNHDRLKQTEAHVRETSAITPDGTFKVVSQKVISADSFAYTEYPKQLQQYTYNEDNKVFQKTILQYDDNKRFLSRNSRYAVGWLYSSVDLNYDSKGRIIDYTNTGNLNGDVHQSTSIKYDSLGKMQEQSIWERGKQRHHIEFMYDNETGLISNKLDRDNEKATISILRFNYETYGVKSDSAVGK